MSDYQYQLKNPFNLKNSRERLCVSLYNTCLSVFMHPGVQTGAAAFCVLLSKHNTCHRHKYPRTVTPALQTSGIWCRSVLKQATQHPQTWLLLVSVWLVISGSDIFCDSTSMSSTPSVWSLNQGFFSEVINSSASVRARTRRFSPSGVRDVPAGLWISAFNPAHSTPPPPCFVRIPMLTLSDLLNNTGSWNRVTLTWRQCNGIDSCACCGNHGPYTQTLNVCVCVCPYRYANSHCLFYLYCWIKDVNVL